MRHEDEAVLHVIAKGIIKILERLNHMSQDISALQAAADRQTSVDASIIALLNQLAQQIKDAGIDPVKLAAIVSELESNNDAVAAAVTANTPVTPAQAAAKS